MAKNKNTRPITAAQASAEIPEGNDDNTNLSKLVGDGSGGATHLKADGSDRANEEGFSHVHQDWYAQTLDYDQLRKLLADEESRNADLSMPVTGLHPVLLNGNIGFELRGGKYDGLSFVGGQHALSQICSAQFADTGSGIIEKLTGDESDPQDREMALALIKNGLRHVDQEKTVFLRLRDVESEQPTVRAILSEHYAVIPHGWLVNVVAKQIPGGRVSHLRFDGDYLRFNTLIPDSLREEPDSRYGGMLACGNDEVGKGRQSTLPSIFRDICYNGCIWGQVAGKTFTKVHKGKIDLERHEYDICYNLSKQIPLLPIGIEKMLSARGMESDGAPIECLLTQVAKNEGTALNKKQWGSMLEAFKVEPLPNAFGLVNAITRAAQNRQFFNGLQQEQAELLAGDLLNGFTADADKWSALVAGAKTLKAADVKEYLALAV